MTCSKIFRIKYIKIFNICTDLLEHWSLYKWRHYLLFYNFLLFVSSRAHARTVRPPFLVWLPLHSGAASRWSVANARTELNTPTKQTTPAKKRTATQPNKGGGEKRRASPPKQTPTPRQNNGGKNFGAATAGNDGNK